MVPYFKIRKLQLNMQCSTFFLTNGFRVNTSVVLFIFFEIFKSSIYIVGLQLRSFISVKGIKNIVLYLCAQFAYTTARTTYSIIFFLFIYFINKLTYPIKQQFHINKNGISIICQKICFLFS